MKLITDVSAEPIALSLLKEHLRLDPDDTSEDSTLSLYLSAARHYAQEVTGKLYGEQSWQVTLKKYYPEVTFPISSITEITSVKYLDSDKVLQTLDSGSYSFDADLQTLTFTALFESEKINILFKAGETTIKPTVKNAILLLVGHLYENRESTTDLKLKNLPLGIINLLNTDKEY